MKPEHVISFFGSIAEAARALQIQPPSISGWISKGEVPIDRQCQIEIITNGGLTADRSKLSAIAPDGVATVTASN